MRIVYTEAALADLDEILAYLTSEFPDAYRSFEQRLHAIERQISRWPESAQRVEQRSNVRVVPFIRHPTKLFYIVVENVIEVVHIAHSARLDPS